MRYSDEEREKAPQTATLMYTKYMSCRVRDFDKAIRRIALTA